MHKILESKNPQKAGYVWNMLGSMLYAFQSVLILMILTRTVGVEIAGIFSLANANANLFINVGKYGMRNFQVSDLKKEYSFREYRLSRVITVVLMLFVSIIYTIFAFLHNSYSMDKALIILLTCALKIPDAYEDVYIGEYQRLDRLDVGSKIMTIRLFFSILSLAFLVVFSRNLIFSLVISILASTVLMILFIKYTRVIIDDFGKLVLKKVAMLLASCFPLFAAAFLAFYIGNAPKYAIDSNLNDELQAIFGFISMPLFIIGLLNSFIFNPLIYKLSRMWEKNEIKSLVKNIGIQTLLVFIITLFCIVGAFLIGIPFLSLLFNIDLSDYKTEFLILLLGGGFLGLSGVYLTILTIMRKQNLIVILYSLVSVLAFLFSSIMVKIYGIIGAVILYDSLMLVLSLLFVFAIFISIEKRIIINKK